MAVPFASFFVVVDIKHFHMEAEMFIYPLPVLSLCSVSSFLTYKTHSSSLRYSYLCLMSSFSIYTHFHALSEMSIVRHNVYVLFFLINDQI